MSKPSGETVPKQIRPVYEAVVSLTDEFCRERLDEEYAELCRRMAAALCRKRPSPLASGYLQTWAGAIVYAAGSLNFLFDKSAEPYLSTGDLAAAFGIAKSTAASKAKVVRDALKIKPYDWRWTLPSRLDSNPLAWYIQVDGLHVDARHLPPLPHGSDVPYEGGS